MYLYSLPRSRALVSMSLHHLVLLFHETILGLINKRAASVEFVDIGGRLITAQAGLQLQSNAHNDTAACCDYGYRPGHRNMLNEMLPLQANVKTDAFKLAFTCQQSER